MRQETEEFELEKKLNEIYELVKKDIQILKQYDDFLVQILKEHYEKRIRLPFGFKKILYVIFDKFEQIENEVSNLKLLNFKVCLDEFEQILNYDIFAPPRPIKSKIPLKDEAIYLDFRESFEFERKKDDIRIVLKIIKNFGIKEFSKEDIVNEYVNLEKESIEYAEKIIRPILHYLLKHEIIGKTENNKFIIIKFLWFEDSIAMGELREKIFEEGFTFVKEEYEKIEERKRRKKLDEFERNERIEEMLKRREEKLKR